MKYDGALDLALGHSRKSKIWKNEKWNWSTLVERLSQENRTSETFKEFIAANKEDQSQIKDVGGYVGGYLRQGRRSPSNVVHRQLLTLDIDFAHLQFWEDYQLMFDNAAVIHATHKHHEKSPRYRLILPMSRECTPDEYVAVARRVAGDLGIDLFDNTTFEPNRLMYWPSNPKDVDYYFKFQDGPWIDVEEMLGRYIDWTDTSLWPTSSVLAERVKGQIDKQQDPESKSGVIGAFCRTYNIDQAIEKFLSKEYTEAGKDRYTYLKGSTSAGMIVYDGKFAFSHHGTDPSSGKLCNSFDLVRLHKFGHLDEGAQSASKSLAAMKELIINDEEVKGVLASERIESAKYDFKDIEDGEETSFSENDMSWMKEMEMDLKGANKSSASNLNLIFNNDPRLIGVFRYNKFDNKRYVFGNLPWRRTQPPELMRDVDYAGIRNYIETIYGITGSLKIEDCISLQFEEHSYHPIKEYIRAQKWDGVERVDHLFVDYFGADNNEYVRQAARKMLVAAIARVFQPGVKYDSVVTFVGTEGTGKSTFVNKLAGSWFSDTFMTVHGKEGLEQLQGAWIIEMAELAGLRKAEVEAVKHFISKQVDMFRPAFARTSEVFPRQCIFIGTTNNKDFLKSTTGNRRFIPIDVHEESVTKSIWDDLTEEEVAQLWAEAYTYYRKGETLYMKGTAQEIAKQQQANHAEVDERSGLVEQFLNTPLPKNWKDRGLLERRLFLDQGGDGTEEREFVCVAEIWCEGFGRDKEHMDRYKTREINEMLRALPGWEAINSTKNFPLYGKQKYYRRIG